METSPTPWSVTEQLIAVALIKYRVFGEPSQLLVPRFERVLVGEALGEKFWEDVETGSYVGIRPEQQQLIEMAYLEASCQSD